MKIIVTSIFGMAAAVVFIGAPSVLADAKADLTAAAKKLAEAKTYSWTSVVDLEGVPFKPGPTTGKVVKDGYLWVSSEMMGNTSEAYLHGTNGIVKVDGEWKTEAELPKPGEDGRPPGGAGPGGGRGRFAGMGARRLLQTKAPHEAALMYIDKIKDLKSTDGTISGQLPDEIVRELASFGRRGRGGDPGAGPSNAKGWIKVKLTDGQITKTILEIESEMRTPDGGTQTVNAITTTEIKDVGTTKLEVPDAVKSKLPL